MNIKPNHTEAYRLLHYGTLALSRAEQQGFRVDVEYCKNQQKILQKRIDKLEDQIKSSNFYKKWDENSAIKVNLYSNAQLGKYLFNVLEIPPVKTTPTGQGSTDEESLTGLNIPELNILLRIRKIKKLKDYLSLIERESVAGVIHPFFNLHLARTFRSSSDSPNFQNLPSRDKESENIVKGALYPRKNHMLLEADFGSLEVRIAACYHKDPTMLKYLHDPTTDMHGDMAKQIYLIEESQWDKNVPEYKHLRYCAKNGFVFPEFYGDYYVNCAEALGPKLCKLSSKTYRKGQGVDLPDKKLSDHLISKGIKSHISFENHIKSIENHFWGDRFPVYNQWKIDWWEEYQKKGYITMKTGFICKGVMGRNDCINYPVQGAAFHCLLWSLIELDRIIISKNWKSRIIGQIHDSIIMDVNPEELEMVKEEIVNITTKRLPEMWQWIIVPLEIEIEEFKINAPWVK